MQTGARRLERTDKVNQQIHSLLTSPKYDVYLFAKGMFQFRGSNTHFVHCAKGICNGPILLKFPQ